MTRAKERLIFSAADYYGEGKKERKLSPFIYEALGARDQVLVTGKNEKQLPLFEWTKPSDLEPRTQSLKPAHADYLSYSAIQSFRECPLHYKLRYILRLPSPARAPLSLGNSVHLALRDFYRLGKDEQTEKTLLELLDKNWILEGYASRKHEAEAKEKAGLFLGDYLRSELHAQAKPLYLEQPFVFRVGQTLKIGGKIDRVDDVGNGVLEIIDYKTGANVPTQKEIDIDLQMTIYALAATDKGVLDTPIDKVRLTFYFFDTQSRITTVRTQEALEEARRELLAIRDEIEKSDFACTGGRTCENCEFKMLCNG
jgi:DNA helicase-2/ATP-dependent DNA helicase PcrA